MPEYTPIGAEGFDDAAYKRKIAMLLMQQGSDASPVGHWTQAAARALQGAAGGMYARDAAQTDSAGQAASAKMLADMLGGGQAATAPQVSPISTGDQSQPRGYRNNNPLNIEAGGFTQSQPGYQGSDGRFAKFESMDQGTAAANKLLDTYQNKHGLNTPAGIINRWAPSSDGNNVNAYAGNVAKALGIDPNSPVPPDKRQQLIAAMAQHENGRPMPQVASAVPYSGPGATISDAEIKQKFPQLASTGPAVPYSGPGASFSPNDFRQPQQQMAQAQIPQQPQQAGGTDQMAARLAKALQDPNPYVRKQAASMASALIAKRMSEDVPSNDQKEYTQAVRQGFKGSIFEYQKQLKEAGKPITNINQQQESEYNKAMGKQFAEANSEIMKSAGNARGKIATLERIGSLLKDPSVYSGAGGQGILELKRLGKLAGIDVGDVGPAEAVKSISNQFALELRNPAGGAGMPGAMSDKDREFLQSMVPGLQQNPEGNTLIIDYMKRVAQRSVDVEKLRQQYVRKTGRLDEGFYNELQDYSEKNPIFTDADRAQTQQSAPAIRRYNPATGKIE